MKNTKGQLAFEFIIAAILFITVIIYVLTFLSASFATYTNDLYLNELELRAIQITELLNHNEGFWNSTTPLSIGLSEGYPVLNKTKMQWLDSYCDADYLGVLEKLDLTERHYLAEKSFYNLKIQVNTTGAQLLDCHRPSLPDIPTGVPLANTERYGISEDNESLILNVWIW